MSRETRDSVRVFAADAPNELRRTQRRLYRGLFTFQPQKGILQKRSGKKPRPIVVADVGDRVVRRAILDVLQAQSAIREDILGVPTSFGAIREKGVREALEAALKAIREGKRFFLRSDIQAFFTRVPRDRAVQYVSEATGDRDFTLLFEAAIETELSNRAALGEGVDLFPVGDEGVAQGSCLSPLSGNIVLREFDRQLNGRGVVCLRYVDDFLLLGTSQGKVEAAFRSGQRILNELGLEAYDPSGNPGKAEKGPVEGGFTFLGCQYSPGLLQPTRKAKRRLLDGLDALLRDGLQALADPQVAMSRKRSVSFVLSEVNNILMGWGNQYAFCNAEGAIADLDTQVNTRLSSYLARALAILNKYSASDLPSWRRCLGVHWLGDSKSNPLIVPEQSRRIAR
ncbi:MAG: reverse transcriptase domain-containing protein [Thermoanaerobaculaceae bacterium]